MPEIKRSRAAIVAGYRPAAVVLFWLQPAKTGAANDHPLVVSDRLPDYEEIIGRPPGRRGRLSRDQREHVHALLIRLRHALRRPERGTSDGELLPRHLDLPNGLGGGERAGHPLRGQFRHEAELTGAGAPAEAYRAGGVAGLVLREEGDGVGGEVHDLGHF